MVAATITTNLSHELDLLPAKFFFEIGGHFTGWHNPEFPAFQATMLFVYLDIVCWPFIYTVKGDPFRYQVVDLPMVSTCKSISPRILRLSAA